MNFFTFIAAPFGYLISWLYSCTNNYLIAVLVAAIVFNICFIWTDILKQRSANKLATMLPDILKIQEKYPNAQTNKKEKEKMNKEITEIYNKNDYTGASTFILPVIKIISNIIFFTAVINPLVYISNLSHATINSIKDTIINTGVNIGNYAQFGIINFINNHDISELTSVIPNAENLNIPNLQMGIFNLGETSSFSWPTIIFPIIIAIITIIPILISKEIKLKDFTTFNMQALSTLLSNSLSVITSVIICFYLPIIYCFYWLFITIIDAIKNAIFKKLLSKKKGVTEN